ncbi:hypothetical protein PFISCL1PPCAC_21236, partial [Pristionchus fissidentatus]
GSDQEFVFQWEVDYVSGVDECGRDSKVHYFVDLPWNLHVYVANGCDVCVLLECDAELHGVEWSCEQESTILLLHSTGEESLAVTNTTYDTFSNGNKRIQSNFIANLKDLLNPEKGFVVDNKMTLEARIRVMEVKGIQKLTNFDFSVPSIGTDLILRVEGREVHVGRQYLATYSPVFAALFYGEFAEKDKADIELKDVEYEKFLDLLHVIYPTGRAILCATFESILELADFYQIKFAIDLAEIYLIRSDTVSIFTKIEMADKFRLEHLKHFCLQSFNTVKEIKDLHEENNCATLSDSFKGELFLRTMELPAE